jgi:outer membrane cobalamin receptor
LARDTVLPTNVSVITREEMLGRPAYSVADLLQGLPGINLEQNGFRGTRAVAKLRGASSSNRTVVLMDGVPLTNEFDGQVDLSRVPLAMVERIEVTRGGSSAIYGAEASGGAINIIMTRPDKKGLVSDVATAIGRDGFKDSNGRFRGRSNLGDLTYAGERGQAGGFINNEYLKSESHFGSLARSFNGKGYWSADYFFHETKMGLPNGTPVAFDQWNGHLEQRAVSDTAQQEQNVQQGKLRFVSPTIADGAFSITLKEGTRDVEDRTSPESPAYLDEEVTSEYIDANYFRHGLQIGVQGQRTRRSIYPLETKKSHQNSAYLTDNWSWNSWTLVPGVRYDKLAGRSGLFSPRLAVIHTEGEHWLFSATAARGFRKPTFNELFDNGAATANPELNAEKSSNYDVGAQWRGGNVLLRVSAFQSRISDLITVSAVNKYENNGHERNAGVETELAVGNDKTRLSGHWTALKSERDTPTSDGYVQSAMTPRRTAFIRLEQKLPWALNFINDVRYQSEQYQSDNRSGVRLPPYYTWDTRIAFRLWQADLYLAMENVTNRRYADTILGNLAPQPGRTFWTGLSIRFNQ